MGRPAARVIPSNRNHDVFTNREIDLVVVATGSFL
jgi:hypothetical protein